MDENNNLTPDNTTPETSGSSFSSGDYVIGGTTTPASEPSFTQETDTSTTDIYEQANTAAINPAASTTTDTPIYTTSDPMASYSVPQSTNYANTETPYQNNTPQQAVSQGFAIASLVLGIITLLLGCCCCINLLFGIPAIVFGILQKPMENGKKPGMAIAGIITASIGIVLMILMYILNAYLESIGWVDAMIEALENASY